MMNMNTLSKVLAITLGSFLFYNANASIVNDTLFINKGLLTTVDSLPLPYIAFNESNQFNAVNKRIFIDESETLELSIFNTDTIEHQFLVLATSDTVTISAGGSSTISLTFNESGAYIFTDPSNNGNNAFLGAASAIIVGDSNPQASFFWNIKEFDPAISQGIADGIDVNWDTFYPEYFTINSRSNPHINSDPIARVTGAVGDTLLIYMINTGRAIHSIHFHGYHSDIVFSSEFPEHVGRSKDTFPVGSMEVVVIRMIPDKPGEYPVHDHNLVAVSGGKRYPNGMFLTMKID